MALPPVSDVCQANQVDLASLLTLCVTLPGGADLCALLDPGDIPDPGTVATRVLGQLNSALTPLMPIFTIIEACLCIFECVKAVPDSIGPPPDPTALIKAIAKCVKKVEELLKLIPQLSVPVFIKGICGVLVAALQGMRDQLNAIIVQQLRIAASTVRAAELNSPDLVAAVACAQDNLDAQKDAVMGGAGPINKFMTLLNAFLQIAGLDPIGEFTAGEDPTGTIELIDVAINALNALCNSLPV